MLSRGVGHYASLSTGPRRGRHSRSRLGHIPTLRLGAGSGNKRIDKGRSGLSKLLLKQQGEFTTRNELEPDRRILMHLVSGPFRMLEGEWLLTPIGAEGCRAELSMRFAFKSSLSALLFEQKFAETAASLVDAFVARARSIT